MSKSIESIEGIGPSKGKKLRECGCTSVGKLLQHGCTKQGRSKLAQDSGISESVILKAVNMADLFRVKGIASQYAELLEAAGVDTVKELRNRNVANLASKMAECNAAKKLVRQVPSESMVEKWVSQAKELPPMVTY